MIELLKFSHNRNEPFKQSCDALRDVIEAFTEKIELVDWYNYFENSYSLPRDVIKQNMKSYLETLYNYQKAVFSNKLYLRKGLLLTAKYIGFLLYAAYKSKKSTGRINTYDLIVDWIEKEIELYRFSKLINLFGKQNVLIVAMNPVIETEYKIFYRPKYKFYDRKEVIRTLFRELSYGLMVYIKLSIKLGINLIPIATHIINQYLNYYSIFKSNRSKYCIQERHYQTSSIKNFLFHKFGGIYSTSIQKNIYQLGRNGFYYDIDVLFSLGNNTADRAFEYGGRIKHVVPVGSMFMEYYWFNYNPKIFNSKYDIVYLGINVSMALHYVDSYSSFTDDYYETFRWLVTFSKKNPHLRIGIKHHSNNRIDEREMEIIKDSSVKRIDQKLNSYEVAFQSKCAVTFGSTMGYELLAHGLPTLFLDPGGRCALLPDPDNSLLSSYRVYNHQDFTDKVRKLLSGQSLEEEKLNSTDLCLNSQQVSERIFSWFSSNNSR